MKKTLSMLMGLILLGMPTVAQEDLGQRPFKEMDICAFCKYSEWHPDYYILDNNWQILCALRTPHALADLDSMGIRWNSSQIRLLQIGGLLDKEGKQWKTQIPIFDQEQTRAIRRETRAFADSLFHLIEPSCQTFVTEVAAQGYEANAYSLMFSYVLDGQMVWKRFPDKADLGHHATWDGVYWAMYEPRTKMKCGTNSYGYLSYTWSDPMKRWPDMNLFVALGKRIREGHLNMDDPDKAARLARYGYTDTLGNLTLPVIHIGQDNRMNRAADGILTPLVDAVKSRMFRFAKAYGIANEEQAAIIFYHELMWDVLDLLTERGIITCPAILTGQSSDPRHLRDVTFVFQEE